MDRYSVVSYRIDNKNYPASVCATGLSWDRVVSYLTCVYEMKAGHSLWAVNADRTGHISVPWFSVMQYNIIKEN